MFEKVRVVKKKHNSLQTVAKLIQANVLIGQDKSLQEVCKELEKKNGPIMTARGGTYQ
jgi:hypothetical protein